MEFSTYVEYFEGTATPKVITLAGPGLWRLVVPV